MPNVKNQDTRHRIIDQLFRRGYKLTTTELKDKILDLLESVDNLTARTIWNDLHLMQKPRHLGGYNAPIKQDKQNKYFYTDTEYTIGKIALNKEEYERLQFALKYLSIYRDSPLFGDAEIIIDKLLGLAYIRDTDDSIQNYIEIERKYLVGSHNLKPILIAIKNHHSLKFIYQKFQNVPSETREVIPLYLKEYSNRWYLIGLDLQKSNQERTFGLGRMSKISSQECDFEYDPIDIQNRYKYAFGITVPNEEIPEEIVIKFDGEQAKYITTNPLHHTQEEEWLEDGFCLITLQVHPTVEFYQKILSYGAKVEILEPLDIRLKMKSILDATLEKYS